MCGQALVSVWGRAVSWHQQQLTPTRVPSGRLIGFSQPPRGDWQRWWQLLGAGQATHSRPGLVWPIVVCPLDYTTNRAGASHSC